VQAKFWQASSVADGSNQLKDGTAYRYIADAGIKSTQHHEGKLLEQIDLNTWVTMSLQRAVDNVSSRLQDGLAFLATVGSTLRSSASSERYGASTRPYRHRHRRARPRSTRSRARWARRSS
jgi:hypothetical protein